MRNPLGTLLLLIVAGGILYGVFAPSFFMPRTKERVKLAFAEYVSGERAEQIGQKQKAFNKAQHNRPQKRGLDAHYVRACVLGVGALLS